MDLALSRRHEKMTSSLSSSSPAPCRPRQIRRWCTGTRPRENDSRVREQIKGKKKKVSDARSKTARRGGHMG